MRLPPHQLCNLTAAAAEYDLHAFFEILTQSVLELYSLYFHINICTQQLKYAFDIDGDECKVFAQGEYG